MNVIVANEQQNALANLDIDIIKSISGSYDVTEIVEMFKSFFYSKMVLDVTAIRNYNDPKTFQILAKGLDPEKIIFLLPEGTSLCTPNFLTRLISFGIYNFTTNLNGVKYLLKKTNTLQDVEHIRKMASMSSSKESGANVATVISSPNRGDKNTNSNGSRVIGFRNVTEHAGATTLIYMLKKEIALTCGRDSVVAFEIEKNDFQLFNDRNMVSVRSNDVQDMIQRASNISVILVDLNNCQDDRFCTDVIYLIEPSTVRLNGLVRKNRNAFNKLTDCKVVLNQSLLLNNDVFDFENEVGIKVFYNMPPLDERKRNAIMGDFLSKLGIISGPVSRSSNSSKIFGLFRR